YEAIHTGFESHLVTLKKYNSQQALKKEKVKEVFGCRLFSKRRRFLKLFEKSFTKNFLWFPDDLRRWPAWSPCR
ncbi:hypothetical protein, partial [Gluconacetobacter entanii]